MYNRRTESNSMSTNTFSAWMAKQAQDEADIESGTDALESFSLLGRLSSIQDSLAGINIMTYN